MRMGSPKTVVKKVVLTVFKDETECTGFKYCAYFETGPQKLGYGQTPYMAAKKVLALRKANINALFEKN